MKTRGIIFDFDGVMADTIGMHTEARIEAFDQLGIKVDPALHDEAHRHGSHPSEIIGWILKQIGLVPLDANVLENETVQKVVTLKSEIYHEHAVHGLNAVKLAPEFINWAVQEYSPEYLAIATTASRLHEVNPFLRRYGLTRDFKAIVGKEDTPIGRLKPDGFVYDEAIRRIGLDRSLLIAIEDTPSGLLAAQTAELPVIGISTTHSAEDLEGAQFVTGSFPEIRSYLEAA